MTQCQKIVKAMLENQNKKVWYAKDFQFGENFIGYEASARMSEVAQMYYDIIIAGKDGRFRTLSVNWDKQEEINKIKELLNEIERIEEETKCN